LQKKHLGKTWLFGVQKVPRMNDFTGDSHLTPPVISLVNEGEMAQAAKQARLRRLKSAVSIT
jgi:hypothetical protein